MFKETKRRKNNLHNEEKLKNVLCYQFHTVIDNSFKNLSNQ